MKSETISIIIPCYNAENYIEKCVESILSGSYTDIELIIVNDGSTDGTAGRLQKFSNDKRVIVIHQKNGGEAAARNAGINVATGEYIGFVDADDYIEIDMYYKLYTAMNENDADLAVCNFNLVYDKQSTQYLYSKMIDGCVSVQNDVYGYFARFCACPRPNNYVWTKLYKRKIIMSSAVRFENFPHSADTLFSFKLLPFIKKTVFVNEGLYNYYQREKSSIHTIATKVNIASLYADTFEALADFYSSNGHEDFLSVLQLHAYTRFRSIFFYSRLAGHTDQEIIETIKTGFKDRKIYDYLTGLI